MICITSSVKLPGYLKVSTVSSAKLKKICISTSLSRSDFKVFTVLGYLIRSVWLEDYSQVKLPLGPSEQLHQLSQMTFRIGKISSLFIQLHKSKPHPICLLELIQQVQISAQVHYRLSLLNLGLIQLNFTLYVQQDHQNLDLVKLISKKQKSKYLVYTTQADFQEAF